MADNQADVNIFGSSKAAKKDANAGYKSITKRLQKDYSQTPKK
jgi:hypothetical protein